MARTATVYKAELSIANMDVHYYETHNLVVAQHPSETNERMMVRLLAFALNASEQLQFTKGLSTDDEPELWQKSLSGEIELWLELGQPDEKRIRKACGRAKQVIIYCYGGRSTEVWWPQISSHLQRFNNLRIINLPKENCEAMESMVQRTMQLNVSIQDGEVSISDHQQNIDITPETLFPA
jgi:uncharacterized protein YaeQ